MLLWQYTGDEVNAEVRFYYYQCPTDPSYRACMIPITWQNRDPYGTPSYPENASYMDKVNIWINPNKEWPTPTRVAQITHEIGHVYGLGEQYIEPDMCNPDVRSIMEVIVGTVSPPYQCDGIQAPTDLDVRNVKWYWGSTVDAINKGDLLFTGASGGGTLGVWRTKDLSWAENAHQVAWYWWNGSTWVMYRDETFVDWIGVHFLTDDRVLYREINRLDYPLVTGPGLHKMCGKPWFQAIGQYGNFRCSNLINVL